MKKIVLLSALIASTLFGTHVFGQSDILELGRTALREAQYEEAIGYLRQAAKDFQQKEDQQAYADCQLLICQSQIGMGDYEEGAATAESILQYADAASSNMSSRKAAALGLFGEAQLNLGRNDLALENLLEAVAIFGSEPSEGLAECYEDLGITYMNNENYDLAIQYHEQALEIRESLFGEDALLVGDSYNNMGLLDVEDNAYLASSNFTRALEIYEDKLGSNHPKVAFCLNNLARAESNLGNFLDAQRHLKRAQEIWDLQYEGDHPNKAFTLSNVGRVYRDMGSFDEAMTQQKEALAMYIRLYGRKHPEVANTYFLIGVLHGQQNQWKAAVEQYQEAIYANLYDQDFQNIEELPELRNYYNADILLSSLWSKVKALETLHLSKSLKPKHLTMALNTVAKCDSLITQIRQLRLNESDKLRLSNLAKEIYEKGIELSLDLSAQPFARTRYYEQAFTFSERSKSAVLLEAIAETAAKSFAGIPPNLLQQEDSLKDQISYLRQKLASQTGGPDEQSWKEQLFATESTYRGFIDQLEADYPRYFSLKYQTKTASLSELRQVMDRDQAILSYFEGDGSIYLFVIDKQRMEIISRPKEEDYLKQITGLRNTIKFRMTSLFSEISDRLYRDLMPSLPKDLTQLLIIPDGALSTIPFEVLAKASEGKNQSRYLVQDYAISYDYSATLHISRLAEEKSDNLADEVLLMAPVSFEEDRQLSTLTASASEVEQLKYLFRGQGWMVDAQTEDVASEASLKAADLNKFRYLHLATHGLVHESQPELSCIYLRRNQDNDGSLYAGELYNLKIGAELVTLSACETGLGKIAKGEGIVGLSRALLYAGAKNLIVSLWQVADQSTAELMIDFYQSHLTESDGSMAHSLRAAKLKMLKSEEFGNPYYWAPFILVGR